MKKVLSVLLLVILVSNVNGQTLLHDASGKIAFTGKVKVDSTDADALYRQAKTWVLENFINLKQVLQKDDPVNHQIILRGSGECYAPHSFGDTIENGPNTYTLQIDIDNNGYTYLLSDFITTDKWKGNLPAEEVKGSKKQLQEHERIISELAATLEAGLKNAMVP
jgi:hypothetical protein